MSEVILIMYIVTLLILFTFGAHGFVMVYHYWKQRGTISLRPLSRPEPPVTIQLPVYNELYVVNRLIDSVCALDYPQEKLEIQVLDDSTDETVDVVREAVAAYRAKGYDIHQICRASREGFKAGALQHGLTVARGEYLAIFDADFVPQPSFLRETLPFFEDPKIGLVQTRWEHLNAEYSLLTRAQAIALDGHFVIEQE
ncbi:MAG: glycosyltransferase, partial [Proteobacteria bacterium]|nr:glycosyltransferase [Pseudomonadota bacterium]